MTRVSALLRRRDYAGIKKHFFIFEERNTTVATREIVDYFSRVCSVCSRLSRLTSFIRTLIVDILRAVIRRSLYDKSIAQFYLLSRHAIKLGCVPH